ncbi:MAG: xanthine phosphoribosyltransferase [Alphaproteobacteria bacterium]|nr:xanthine phosphoribosyltransferase [Alphaproteobacteria bacterium]
MNKPSTFRETRPVSWQDVHRDSLALAGKLATEGPWHTIAAITRGGMTPAQILAIELGIRHVETIGIASYEGRDQGPPRILKACEGSGEGWLVVDDIVDTGATAEIVRTMLPEACLVAIYVKPDGEPLVDHYVTEIPQDVWIEFPWNQPATKG